MKLIPNQANQERFLRDLKSRVIGSSVTIDKRECDWVIEFASRFVMAVGTLWRLVGATYVCVTSEDHGHQFGLPAPVDAAAKANDLLSEATIQAVEFDARTGDLRFHFNDTLSLEIVTTSSGYESWQMWEAGEFFAVGAHPRADLS